MAKSRLAKSLLSLVVKVGETVEGKDIFKKVRIGFLNEDANDDGIFDLGKEIAKMFSYQVEDIVKENAYTVENN